MSRRILVTGASVAGCICACVLARHGFDVTVVEKFPAFRDGGQNIDVRGVGREVLRRLGLEQAALAQGTGEEGTVWVDARGKAAARFAAADLDGDGPTAEMEILRGDLARLIYDATRDRATFRFGDHVTSVIDEAKGVAVTLARGGTERYDALVIAEGVGSATRELVFAGENDPCWMDMILAYFTIARSGDDDRMWGWYNAPGRRSVSLRPDRHGTTRAMLSLSRKPGGEQAWNVERQKAFLREQFGDAGWETPRVLKGMDTTEDFYCEVLRQVRMPRWSRGHIVLTGDAAWCATPLAGIGTTLAVTGPYVLAEEIARHDDVAAAFAAYERQMRPMVEDGQGVPSITPRLMHPKSRLGIRCLHGALWLASLPAIRNRATKAFAGPGKEVELSRYT